MTPEANVKQRIRERFEALGKTFGVVWSAPPANGFGKADMLDFVVCVNGRYLEVEAKATASSPVRPRQRDKLERVNAGGGVGLLVHAANLHELDAALAALLEIDIEEISDAVQVFRTQRAARDRARRMVVT